MKTLVKNHKMENKTKKNNQFKEASMISSNLGLLYASVKIGVVVFSLLILSTSSTFAAGDGDLFTNAGQLLNDVYSKFVAFSTAAAGVGVGTGVFMKKLSLGKQDKIELGNKVIKDSLIGWSVLNGLGLILSFLSNYTK